MGFYLLESSICEHMLPICPDELFNYVGCDAYFISGNGERFDWDGLDIEELKQINAVAALYENCGLCSAVDAYIFINICYTNISDHLLEIANAIMFADDIPFYTYDFEDCKYMYDIPNTEKFGRTVAENNGLTKQLKQLDIESYFNYDSYGEEICYGVTLFDDGYFTDEPFDINLNTYSWNDIFEEADLIGFPEPKLKINFDEVFA